MGRHISALALVLLASLALAGCTTPGTEAQTKPTPTSTGAPTTPDPTPTPTVDDPLTAVVAIVVRPENLDLNDAAGSIVRELSYDAEAADFVAAMSVVLRADPTVSEYPGGMESMPWTEYQWPGLRLLDDHETGEYEQDMNLTVIFEAPTVGQGVAVGTIQGFQPGEDLAWLAEWMDEPYNPEGNNQVQAERGPDIGPRELESYANANSVAAQDYAGTSVILAPWNFGIGHV